ncbi:ATP-dependent nuclease [Brevibacillus laterosporus]|uniref:ATP-dependent endonuclease n=1 Tax=Brevibacillus laterosporus TaxID=1465 RepID=A0AAP8QC85_BRELA|nr:AAA family ATPase [Brevibacillus laterosporus]MED1662778.1 AAA family ATPase [Brevibacillus laterosporus]MED1669096.1 AAA family ATPase [Brevibacillus laterosporus]MED1720571.1 AAA family ATPase [Brevibacillus laterosporus]PPA88362.1 ATP-dependent endonuclease [Brevibacillus laterosporus]PPA93918.1 ATP-dependent endonuclease [Brevibacillus laterosporus]
MKLSKLTIRNYKGIKELEINLENISIIIGPNNCSKSTVLQAIKQFGSKEKRLDSSIYYKYNTANPISFHATFTDITDEEAELRGIRASMHEETGTFIVRAVYRYGADVERVSKKTGDPIHDMGNEGWTGRLGGGANGSHFLNVFPDVIYIPAVKDASDEIKNSSDNVKVLSSLYKDIIQDIEEYNHALEKTKELQRKINTHENEQINFFQQEVQSFLNEVTTASVNFQVNFKPLDDFISSSINAVFQYNGIETDVSSQGSGVQRTFIVSMLKGYKKYQSQFTDDEISARRPIIFAIEEPELYLHPHIARVFKDTLYQLADDPLFQVIATSHSANFIDLSKPNRTLIRFALDPENDVFPHQVSSDIYGMVDEEREKFQALLKFNPHVNEVFFAKRAILVEGDTEVVAFKYVGEMLVREGVLSPDELHRTTVVNCAGKPTMYVILNVLNNFGIPYTVVHDCDITELGKDNKRRSTSTLKQAITINYKLEKLAEVRGNKKYVLQHTFEAEMPDTYEKGTSKSYAAYEYFKNKNLDELPLRLLNIIKASYGLPLEVPMVHRIQELIQYYLIENPEWLELKEAYSSWDIPVVDIQQVWGDSGLAYVAADIEK